MPKIIVGIAEQRLTAAAGSWIESVLFDGALAIDATVGNGYDTLFLANCVGPRGTVLGFDIQKAALAGARELLKFTGSASRVSLIHDSHSHLENYLPQGAQIQAVMFNLGYLPRGNRELVTRPDTTIAAIEAVMRHFASNGRITVLVYRGHSEGIPEYEKVRQFLENLPENEWLAEELLAGTDSSTAPRLFRVAKETR
jgi:tRNA1(Val) A37 N6-methylase TrmN6